MTLARFRSRDGFEWDDYVFDSLPWTWDVPVRPRYPAPIRDAADPPVVPAMAIQHFRLVEIADGLPLYEEIA